jgi:hypothetical protein
LHLVSKPLVKWLNSFEIFLQFYFIQRNHV